MKNKTKLTHNEYNKQLREHNKKLGLCISCSNKSIAGTVRCEYHTEQHRTQDKKYKDSRRNKGVCVECGNLAKTGYSKCEKHITVTNNTQKKYITRKRKEWKTDNKCIRCGTKLNPEMDGSCVKCLNCRIEAHLPFKKTDFKF